MSKVYTEQEIKDLVLNQVNSIKKLSDLSITFTSTDSTQAYDTAVRECGFVVPTSTDTDIDAKNTWLINRQRRWYYYSIREKLLLLIENGDLKGGGIVDRLSKVITEMDAEFQKAKEAEGTAHLFLDATEALNSSSVIPSGFVDDRVGQDITTYES